MSTISVSLVPGYQFPTDGSVAVTYALLNQLGTPTINLTGAIGTLALADGSVTTAKLADNALAASATGRGKLQDGFFSADATGRAKFAAGFYGAGDATSLALFGDGIWTPVKLAESTRQDVHQYATGTQTAGVYAVTLTPAATAYTAGMVVRFKADTASTGATDINVNGLGAKNIFRDVTAELNANDILANEVVTLVYDGTNFQFFSTKTANFTSAEQNVSQNTATIAVAHSLGVVPTRVRWVLVCKTGELGYTAGDEVDVSGATDSGNNGPHMCQGANATNVFLVIRNNANIQLFNYSTQAATTITAGNWKFKAYAWK